MNEVKISKKELIKTFQKSIQNLEDIDMPGSKETKEKSKDFIELFKNEFDFADVDYSPLSEIIALLVLENQEILLNKKKQI